MTLLVDALAGYRLTRLITADVITEPLRGAVIRAAYVRQDGPNLAADLEDSTPGDTWTQRANDDPYAPTLARFITCPWCVGVWVAAGVVTARRVAPGPWAPVAEAATVAAAAGLIASWEH